ncbi:hypothetical protein CYMTET_56321 [Cymbomonas tetramitiformis]|uniref:PI3K/PI4K catalytic domain-containing protein n=1 Tax=Cymbomonas tetramitiformis TaxID=36881 RepID=A0AAE0BCK4_9CHLO|nr:hypothetical protein CYMTET_56321 [Cymbomonas tetramitiformis]
MTTASIRYRYHKLAALLLCSGVLFTTCLGVAVPKSRGQTSRALLYTDSTIQKRRSGRLFGYKQRPVKRTRTFITTDSSQVLVPQAAAAEQSSPKSFRGEDQPGAGAKASCPAIPAWSQCSTCMQCSLDAAPGPQPGCELAGAAETCAQCAGCNAKVDNLPGTITFMGMHFKIFRGASGAYIYKMAAGSRENFETIIKIRVCPPDGIASNSGKCTQQSEASLNSKLLELQSSVQAVAEECGIDNAGPKTWLGSIQTVAPEHAEELDAGARRHAMPPGTKINGTGIFMEYINGVSLRSLTGDGQDKLPSGIDGSKFLSLLSKNKEVSKQVRNIAMMEVLFSSGDRNTENVLITDQGDVRIIDNDFMFGKCSIDKQSCINSIFIPGTKWYEIGHGAGINPDWTLRLDPLNYKHHATPAQMLDYRCHVAGGAIGFDFPPKMAQCMKKFTSLKPTGLRGEYGLDAKQSRVLYRNAKYLLEYGFEETIRKVATVHQQSYSLRAPCCSFSYHEHRRVFMKDNCTMKALEWIDIRGNEHNTESRSWLQMEGA